VQTAVFKDPVRTAQ